MLGTLVLLSVQLFLALYLERLMPAYAVAELVVIALGTILAVAIFSAEYRKQPCWKTNIVFYTLTLANVAFLWYVTRAHWTSALGLLFSLVGIVRSIGKLDSVETAELARTADALETYSTSPKEQRVDPDPIYVNLAKEEWKDAVSRSSVVSPKRRRGRPKGSRNKR